MGETARILLVTGNGEAWKDVVARLGGEDFAFEVADPAAALMEVASTSRQGDRVVIIDLSPNLARGMETVTAFRNGAPAAPVVAVAENPSVDLERSIRASGVFYLALHPVTADEMRTVLEDALRSIGRHKPSTSTCRTRKRILIVDDDTDYCASVRALLEAEGYTVHCAPSAKEGLRRLETERPDLIVLDIMMEDAWAGYGVNQAVKYGEKSAQIGSVPILMVSSIAEPPQSVFPMAGEAEMITPDDYLTKPLDIRVFLEHVRRLLAQPAGSGKIS